MAPLERRELRRLEQPPLCMRLPYLASDCALALPACVGAFALLQGRCREQLADLSLIHISEPTRRS
eukprot:2901822-Prymnesium_polylepis.1